MPPATVIANIVLTGEVVPAVGAGGDAAAEAADLRRPMAYQFGLTPVAFLTTQCPLPPQRPNSAA